MNSGGCRINVILALGEGHAGDLPLRELKRMTSAVTHPLVPEPLHCFVRIVDRFDEANFNEIATSPGTESVLIISEELIALNDRPRASDLATKILDCARQCEVPTALIALTPAGNPVPTTPPPGLDWVVAGDADLPSKLTEAIQVITARLWLTLPTPALRPRPRTSDTASEVAIDFPRNADDFRKILELRYKIYSVLGYLPPRILEAKSRCDLDPFDPNAIHLAARDTSTGQIVGCARLIVPDPMLGATQRLALGYPTNIATWCQELADQEESDVYRRIIRRGSGGNPLPGASMKAYNRLRETWQMTHPGLRAEDCCELSRLIVHPDARGQRLSRRLTEAAVQIALTWLPRTIMLVECREHHRSLYERFGFQHTDDSGPEDAGLLRTTAIAMWRDLRAPGQLAPRQPNARVALPALDTDSSPQDPIALIRGALPMESWIWDRGATFADRAQPGIFRLSVHNIGLAYGTVSGLSGLLIRFRGRRVSISNQDGDSIDIVPSGSSDVSVASVVPALVKLLKLSK